MLRGGLQQEWGGCEMGSLGLCLGWGPSVVAETEFQKHEISWDPKDCTL